VKIDKNKLTAVYYQVEMLQHYKDFAPEEVAREIEKVQETFKPIAEELRNAPNE